MRATLLSILLVSCTHAATTPPPSTTQEPALAPEKVVRSTLLPLSAVPRGGHGNLELTLQIAAGYHVMSNQPSNPLYIATRVRFLPLEGITLGDPSYPAPKSFPLGDETIATFEGEIAVRVPFEVAPDAAPGIHELKGTLEYQSCTKTSCLFPVQRPLDARVEVAP